MDEALGCLCAEEAYTASRGVEMGLGGWDRVPGDEGATNLFASGTANASMLRVPVGLGFLVEATAPQPVSVRI